MPLSGFVEGMRQGTIDNQARKMNELGMEQGREQLRSQQMANQQAELEMESNAQIMDLMRKRFGAAADGQSPSSVSNDDANPTAAMAETGKAMKRSLVDDAERQAQALDELANIHLARGKTEKADKFMQTASTIRTNASLIQQREQKDQMERLELAANLLTGVRDRKSWQEANLVYAAETGEASPFAEMEYSPELVKRIQSSVVDQKTQAAIKAEQAKAYSSAATAKASEARVKLIEAQTALADQRTADLKKAGATTRQPKAGDVQIVSDQLIARFPDLTTQEARAMAQPVAEEMLRIMDNNSIPRSEAIVQAVENAKQRGDFAGLKPAVKKKGSKAAPQGLPKDKKGNYDKAQLRENRIYVMDQGRYAGKPMMWTGTGFVPVKAGQMGEGEDEEEESGSALAGSTPGPGGGYR